MAHFRRYALQENGDWFYEGWMSEAEPTIPGKFNAWDWYAKLYLDDATTRFVRWPENDYVATMPSAHKYGVPVSEEVFDDGYWIPSIFQKGFEPIIPESSLDKSDQECYTLTMGQNHAASLIPLADKYLDNGFNVLLIGPHGTGKTQSLLDLAEERNLKMKYYSCSTLDPYTDLVGVPVPQVDENNRDFLKMVRPLEIDEAEIIFFDEFNRADPKTLNAIFEIIQFKSINGEKLPNLKACWAAMNPPDDEYHVEELDPALVDRFDVFIEVKPQPSVQYMSQFIPEGHAQALKMWWDAHGRGEKANAANAKNKDKPRINYVSPRRLMKIGLVWMATHNARAIKSTLPPGGSFDAQKLINLLRAADDPNNKSTAAPGIGDAEAAFDYTPTGLLDQRYDVIDFLQKNPMALETHKTILDTLKAGVGGKQLVENFGDILDAINPAQLEAFVTSMPVAKQSHMRTGFKLLHQKRKVKAQNLQNLYKILAKDARAGTMPII